MRILLGALMALAACRSAAQGPVPVSAATTPSTSSAAAVPGSGPAGEAPAASPREPAPAAETLTADTPRTTVGGHRFIAPREWSIVVRGAATILTPPEDGNSIALVDVHASDPEAALQAGWAAYRGAPTWPIQVARTEPSREGWTNIHVYAYLTSPNERRSVAASVRNAGGDGWLVTIEDMQIAVGQKRDGQITAIFDHLQPRGFERESFAGKPANQLDKARIAKLGRFVESARQRLGVPGVAVGLVQGGKVVFSGGFGVRALGGTAAVDGNTLFMIASNTKAMTTLMLGKLVDEHRLTWDTPVTELLPGFRLGSPETTRKVLVKHLVCACTGLPRQDLEWIMQFQGLTPEAELAVLATIEPTTKFGELYQYSNPLAAAAGYVGGHVAFPALALGAAYDEAMRTRVFEPLGMRSTTFDFARALRGNHASPHSSDIDGKPARGMMDINYAIVPLRPAGGAWSNANDVLRYVQMELDNGMVGGKRYLQKDTLLARRASQVAIGKDLAYGMGLEVDSTYGVPVVHHGGSLSGYKTDMMWLPDHGVGAVVLTNSDRGTVLHTEFRRKLLEVLFDGKPEAEEDIAAAQDAFLARVAADRKRLTVPAERAEVARLADRYVNPALGELAVRRDGDVTVFDLGEWKSEVASRRNPDGSISFVTVHPGVAGFGFVVSAAGEKRALILRDGQHEYVFSEP